VNVVSRRKINIVISPYVMRLKLPNYKRKPSLYHAITT